MNGAVATVGGAALGSARPARRRRRADASPAGARSPGRCGAVLDPVTDVLNLGAVGHDRPFDLRPLEHHVTADRRVDRARSDSSRADRLGRRSTVCGRTACTDRSGQEEAGTSRQARAEPGASRLPDQPPPDRGVVVTPALAGIDEGTKRSRLVEQQPERAPIPLGLTIATAREEASGSRPATACDGRGSPASGDGDALLLRRRRGSDGTTAAPRARRPEAEVPGGIEQALVTAPCSWERQSPGARGVTFIGYRPTPGLSDWAPSVGSCAARSRLSSSASFTGGSSCSPE